jgi:rhodanese-related sulfurtransferase
MHKRAYLYLASFLLLIGLLLTVVGCSGSQTVAMERSGPEPNFSLDGSLYISIEDVKRELDRGADFIILDARPKPDYELDHIAGAISMPFFEVEQRYKELPRDKWIVTYCACPRAEAEHAAKILLDKGFQKVKVMYEGYFEWLARQYPVAKGSERS